MFSVWIGFEGDADGAELEGPTLELLSSTGEPVPGCSQITPLCRSEAHPRFWRTPTDWRVPFFPAEIPHLCRSLFIAEGNLCMRIRLSLKAGSSQQLAPGPPLRIPEKTLARQLSRLVRSPARTDVVLAAGGKEFPAHWDMLACRSEVFEKMSQAGMVESVTKTVTIPDLDATTLSHMLDYIYTGLLPDLETKPTSPVGIWHYGPKGQAYEMKYVQETLTFTEKKSRNVQYRFNLAQVSNSVWTGALDTGDSIKLCLEDGIMKSEYREIAEPDDVGRHSAHNPNAEADVAQKWGSLLRAADKYGLAELVEICEEMMVSNFTVYSVPAVLEIADAAGRQALKRAALNFMTASQDIFRVIQSTLAFESLPKELMAEAIQNLVNPMPWRKRSRRADAELEWPDGFDWERLSSVHLRSACEERDIPSGGSREHLLALLKAREEQA